MPEGKLRHSTLALALVEMWLVLLEVQSLFEVLVALARSLLAIPLPLDPPHLPASH